MLPVFHWDLETFLIAPGIQAPPPVCIQFAVDDGPEEIIHVKDPAFRRVLEWALANALMDGHNVAYDSTVICAAYPDLIQAVFQAYREDRIVCTKMRQSLIDIALGEFEGDGFNHWGYTLVECVFRASNKTVILDKTDPWRLRYGTLYNTPVINWPPEARHYALMDATGQRLLFNHQRPGAPVLRDQFRKSRTAFWLELLRAWGMVTDLPRVQEFHRLSLEEMAKDRRIAERAGLVKPDGVRNTKEAMELMVRVMLDLEEEPELTDTGLDWQKEEAKARGGIKLSAVEVYLANDKYIKLDEDACLTSGNDILQAYQRYGSTKMLMTRIERLYKGTEIPLQARFQTIKETGRTSCQMGEVKDGESPAQWGFQFQNTPRLTTRICFCGRPEEDHKDPDHGAINGACETFKRSHDVGIKECFVPRPGFLFCSVDGDTMELHSWAQCCLWSVGKSRMAEVLNRGDDPHTELGATLAHITKAEAYAIRRKERGPEAKKVFDNGPRQSGKIGDFGFPGGMGFEALRKQARALYRVFMSLGEAKNLKDAWRLEWPEGPLWFDWIGDLIGKRDWDPEAPPPTGTVEAFMSGLVRGKVRFTQACNFFFQALTASAMTDAGFPIAWECYLGSYFDGRPGVSPLYGSRIVNFEHDAYLLEVPDGERGHHAAYRQRDIIVDVCQLWHPNVKITASPALMRRWSKAAEETINGDGMLIPWEDK